MGTDPIRPGAALPRRLRGLSWTTAVGHRVPIARRTPARVLGLALLDPERAGPGLLIPRCRSVHTFGMRFALDLLFLDRRGRVIRTRLGVPPGRIVFFRRAAAVLELPVQPCARMRA